MLDEEGIAGSPFPPRDAITESPLTGHALPNVDPNRFPNDLLGEAGAVAAFRCVAAPRVADSSSFSAVLAKVPRPPELPRRRFLHCRQRFIGWQDCGGSSGGNQHIHEDSQQAVPGSAPARLSYRTIRLPSPDF